MDMICVRQLIIALEIWILYVYWSIYKQFFELLCKLNKNQVKKEFYSLMNIYYALKCSSRVLLTN